MLYNPSVADYLRECNDHQVPIEDFQGAFCIRCFQPECSRSQYGKSKFDTRVSTWAERLFLNVPRLDPHDPRYGAIAEQKFLTLDTGRTPEVSSWVDPNEPQQEAPSKPPPAQASSSVASALPRHMLQANAPSQNGKILGPGVQVVRKDPWAIPAPPTDPVVAPGSRIKLGGSGV